MAIIWILWRPCFAIHYTVSFGKWSCIPEKNVYIGAVFTTSNNWSLLFCFDFLYLYGFFLFLYDLSAIVRSVVTFPISLWISLLLILVQSVFALCVLKPIYTGLELFFLPGDLAPFSLRKCLFFFSNVFALKSTSTAFSIAKPVFLGLVFAWYAHSILCFVCFCVLIIKAWLLSAKVILHLLLYLLWSSQCFKWIFNPFTIKIGTNTVGFYQSSYYVFSTGPICSFYVPISILCKFCCLLLD